MEDENNVVFTPELILEYRLTAGKKTSNLKIKTASDAFLILNGIKEISGNNLVLVYLDADDVVVAMDSFVCGIDAFDVPQTLLPQNPVRVVITNYALTAYT